MILAIGEQTGAPVREICRVLKVPRSSFYHAAIEAISQRDDERLGNSIEAIFKRNRKRYGHRRIWHEMAAGGEHCAPSRIRRIMRQRGLRAIAPKHFVPKTSDGKASKPSPNLLEGEPAPERPNQVWTSDITFIPTDKARAAARTRERDGKRRSVANGPAD